MMCSALTNIVANPTQSRTGVRWSRPDHAEVFCPRTRCWPRETVRLAGTSGPAARENAGSGRGRRISVGGSITRCSPGATIQRQ